MDWLTLQCGDWRWRVRPEWAPLLDASGLQLQRWREQGLVQPVKTGPHRTVYRVELPEGQIYVKHYPLSDLRARLRQRLRPSKARTEAERAIAIAARGVPTIEPLAYGETMAGESWLVTRGVENAVTLRELIESHLTPAGESSSLRGPSLRDLDLEEHLAQLLAAMHDAGVLHKDLHAGNILAQVHDESVRLFLIDLHAVRLTGPLDWPASRDNLVMLNRWFVQRSTRPQRLRFWRHYVGLRRFQPWNGQPLDDLARDLEQRTWQSCLEFWRRRERRPLGTNRYFYRRSRRSESAWAVRDLPEAVLNQLLDDPDAPFRDPVRLLKHSRSSTVAEIRLPFDDRTWIYKRFAVTKWSEPWVHLARPTPALRSWINGHRLLECGLPTPRPVAIIHRNKLGLTQECYLLQEKLPDAVELHRFVAGLANRPPSERRGVLLEMLEQAARLVRALHDRNLSHRDLKAANLLVCPDADGYQLYFVDLVGMERLRNLRRARRVQNLARLNVSFRDQPLITRTDRLRFLRVYLRFGLNGPGDWKEWWRAIAAMTAAKIEQNRRRGRVLS